MDFRLINDLLGPLLALKLFSIGTSLLFIQKYWVRFTDPDKSE
ncbi:MAG: hypothetical protein ACFCU4_07650 [Puniceicoccaceae bacterium]